MRREVKHLYKSNKTVTNITGNISTYSNDKLKYALAERIVIKEGYITSQYYNHFLSFIEVLDINLNKDFEAGFLMKESCMLLFIMLDGNITLYNNAGSKIAIVQKGKCLAMYNEGQFSYHLSPGRHQLCYIIPRLEWVKESFSSYPGFDHFLHSIKSNSVSFQNKLSCIINNSMSLRLKKLFGRKETDEEDLEATLMQDVKIIFRQYHKLIETKLTQKVYLIRDYIECNYANQFINNDILAENFHITKKTLIKIFKDEFRSTPHKFLINTRLQQAKLLLTKYKTSPRNVWFIVGYRDYRSFSIQFKKLFGIPPSECF
ncbi:helix-turn-helix domain-containing protein [Sphingobacterium spiritivorum]|uniref:helix-turn-helix domain-containing protein n=1 Tax=Sphingobacterium spiritivorum TaxID=258 RepID=UPI003DA62BD2